MVHEKFVIKWVTSGVGELQFNRGKLSPPLLSSLQHHPRIIVRSTIIIIILESPSLGPTSRPRLADSDGSTYSPYRTVVSAREPQTFTNFKASRHRPTAVETKETPPGTVPHSLYPRDSRRRSSSVRVYQVLVYFSAREGGSRLVVLQKVF